MAKPQIQDHPDYPFLAKQEARIRDWVADFLDAPRTETAEGELLREFLRLVHQYAFLERIIQGDVLFELPVHVRMARKETASSPEIEGESLAAEELALLEFHENPATGLMEELEDMGIKVIAVEGRWTPPPEDSEARETEEPSTSGELVGGFFFQGELGPAILIAVSRDRPESAFILAHELGHLVADVDPYRSRFCRWDARTLRNKLDTIEERRADRFARALLLPEVLLRRALAEADSRKTSPKDPDWRWELLTALFEIPAVLVQQRLLDLGIPDLGPLEETSGPREEETSGPREKAGSEGRARFSLPARFVNLALAAYIERLMESEVLARFLHLEAEEAEQMLEWAQIPRRKRAPDEGEDEGPTLPTELPHRGRVARARASRRREKPRRAE